VSEGGYDLAALAGSLRAAIDVLDGSAALADLPAPAGDTRRADAALNAVRPHQAKFWTI